MKRAARELRTFPTGVRRLDDILGGGLLVGAVYLVAGVPGSGKTIFGNQLCFERAKSGDATLFVTMLAESHSRMLGHIRDLSFFVPELVGTSIHYVSAFSTLEKGGLDGVRDVLRRSANKYGARIIVVDGVHALEQHASDSLAFQRFVRSVQAFASVAECTVVFLSPHFSDEAPIVAMVDGVIELSHRQFGPRAVRELTVHKFRGSANLLGRHEVEIGPDGLVIHPRTEVAFSDPPEHATEQRRRVRFGIRELDAMFAGGVLSSSSTMLLGAAGTGKTVLGLNFLAEGARLGEPGMYFGFYETPPRLVEKARSLGIPLEESVKSGMLEIQWQPPLETNLDSLAERLLERIHERSVHGLRLFIDGVAGFRDAAVYPDRLKRFFAALTHQLRTLDVTTVVSEETPLFHGEVELPNEDFAAVVENIVLLRHVEYRSQLRRLIAILKSRESTYDSHIRDFTIDERGVRVSRTFAEAERLLAGQARPTRARKKAKPRARTKR